MDVRQEKSHIRLNQYVCRRTGMLNPDIHGMYLNFLKRKRTWISQSTAISEETFSFFSEVHCNLSHSHHCLLNKTGIPKKKIK